MIDKRHPLLLGSSSPRRRELLTLLRIPFVAVASGADENPRSAESPDAYLERVVLEKLGSVLAEGRKKDAGAILVADTLVLLDGVVMGKPTDRGDAERMLHALSGRTHEVWTRFAIANSNNPHPVHAETVCTRVEFRLLTQAEIGAYAASGEGQDKAGAYAVQGLGAFAVLRIDGSYPNVVGLPVCELVVALRRNGLLDRFPV